MITALFRMNPERPLFPVADIRRLTYSVTVDGFIAPSLKVRTLLYFDRENRWFHVAWEITGAGVEVPEVTVTDTAVWWLTLPLSPVTVTV